MSVRWMLWVVAVVLIVVGLTSPVLPAVPLVAASLVCVLAAALWPRGKRRKLVVLAFVTVLLAVAWVAGYAQWIGWGTDALGCDDEGYSGFGCSEAVPLLRWLLVAQLALAVAGSFWMVTRLARRKSSGRAAA